MSIRFLAAAWALSIAAPALSQPITVSGEVRQRSELDDRSFDRSVESNTVHLLRTRLAVEARPTSRMRAFVQVQDSRAWGSESSGAGRGTLDGDADQFDLHQGYFELDSLGGAPVSVRVGRQELVYGNERIVGALGWSNIGRTFDAARLRWSGGAVTADLVGAQLVEDFQTRPGQAFGGAFVTWAPSREQKVEAFGFVDTDDALIGIGPEADEPMIRRGTVGARAVGNAGIVGIDAELIGQLGRIGNRGRGERDDVRAWLGSAEASVNLGLGKVALGATQLSGDNDPSDDTYGTFDTLFATNHKFYGAMDYLPALAGAFGLRDVYVALSRPLGKRAAVSLAAHTFATAADVDVNGSRHLGEEIDFSARYMVARGPRIDAGVSTFFPDSRLGNRDVTTWAYVMATVGF